MKIRPIAGNVLLRPLPDEYETSSKLFVPMAVEAYSRGGGNAAIDRAPERGKWHRGEVVAVAEHGKLTRTEKGPGRLPPPNVKPGDTVLYDELGVVPLLDGLVMASQNALKCVLG